MVLWCGTYCNTLNSSFRWLVSSLYLLTASLKLYRKMIHSRSSGSAAQQPEFAQAATFAAVEARGATTGGRVIGKTTCGSKLQAMVSLVRCVN